MLGAIKSAIAKQRQALLTYQRDEADLAPMKPPKITRPPSGMFAICRIVSRSFCPQSFRASIR